jgi:WD repeat-containing protein 48
MKRDRLIANDFIQIRKVMEHVYEKVLPTTGVNMGTMSSTTSQQSAGSAGAYYGGECFLINSNNMEFFHFQT